MAHIFSCIVQNRPGVLAHVSGMFAARGFNIDSLVVGRTEDPQLSRMTIVVIGDDRVLEQVRKQLGKVVPVVKIRDFAGVDYVERDLVLAENASFKTLCGSPSTTSGPTLRLWRRSPSSRGFRSPTWSGKPYGRL